MADVTNYAMSTLSQALVVWFTKTQHSRQALAQWVLPDDGVLALSAGHMLGENFYVVGGIYDANGKSDEIFDGLAQPLVALITLYHAGIRLDSFARQIYTDKTHVTFWDFGDDARHSNSLSAEGGSGVNFSWSQFTSDQVMPFVLGGLSEGDAGLWKQIDFCWYGVAGLGKPTNNLGNDTELGK
ncbi:hypothetical protein OH492_09870 [Vibrio chagasii]|nr:hypothetical protein [Vibrio chagasii]